MLEKISIFDTPDFTFDDPTHIYTYKGKQFPSVTGVISNFHAPFDSDYWLERKAEERGVDESIIKAEWDFKRDYACDLGTDVHEWIEDYYNEKWRPLPANEDRMNRVKKFLDLYVSRLCKLQPLAMELRIWAERWNLAGTIDALFLRHDYENQKTYLLVGDWKTNKKFTYDEHPDVNGRYKLLAPFDDLLDTKHNDYSIQISIYRLMLAEHGIETDGGFLVHLGPDDQPGKIFKAKDLREPLEKYLDEQYGNKKLDAHNNDDLTKHIIEQNGNKRIT